MTDKTIQRMYRPYWCPGDPRSCRWADAAGPAGVLGNGSVDTQAFPHVGLFNLMWLMLDNPSYEGLRTSAEKRLVDHVIFQVQHERMESVSLADVAALRTLPEFSALVMQHRPPSHVELTEACLRKMSGQLKES